MSPRLGALTPSGLFSHSRQINQRTSGLEAMDWLGGCLLDRGRRVIVYCPNLGEPQVQEPLRPTTLLGRICKAFADAQEPSPHRACGQPGCARNYCLCRGRSAIYIFATNASERLMEEHGFSGDYMIVKDCVRSAQVYSREIFTPLTHPPGEA
jgi:hypothetical protein